MKYLISLFFFGAGLFGIWHHKFIAGAIWDWSTIWQPWHHEGLAFWSILIGIGIIIWGIVNAYKSNRSKPT